MCLEEKLIRPRMRGRARPWASVASSDGFVQAPRERLVRKRRHPLIGCVTNTRSEVARIAGDRHRGGRGRGRIEGGKRAARAWGGLIGPTNRNDADIHV